MGKGLPCSFSRRVVSAARPIIQRSPNTAQIRSRRYCDCEVDMAKAISLARTLLCFVLVNSGSPCSWLWMATKASKSAREPRIPPGKPERNFLKADATSCTSHLICPGIEGQCTVPEIISPSESLLQ